MRARGRSQPLAVVIVVAASNCRAADFASTASRTDAAAHEEAEDEGNDAATNHKNRDGVARCQCSPGQARALEGPCACTGEHSHVSWLAQHNVASVWNLPQPQLLRPFARFVQQTRRGTAATPSPTHSNMISNRAQDQASTPHGDAEVQDVFFKLFKPEARLVDEVFVCVQRCTHAQHVAWGQV